MFNQISGKLDSWVGRNRLANSAKAVARMEHPSDLRPVVFFNASARLGHLSQNAAFALLAGWGLRLAGVPILHFVCNAGMSRCVLGTNPDDPQQAPPCASCTAQSKRMYLAANVKWFSFGDEKKLRQEIEGLNIAQLGQVESDDLHLGELVLPSLRWALRRHDLIDDEGTRLLIREYILSARNVALEFEKFLEATSPQAVVVFNGIMFPEGVARQVAIRHKVRVITHEVALRPLSAFFTSGQATAYPMDISLDFQLTEQQDSQLDEYLSRRFRGDFNMAGIQFWREIQDLPAAFVDKASRFSKIVPIFTNVVFDTSQVHANTLFSDMFAWLDEVRGYIKSHPEVLFVIRAHPDELRPGTRKKSRQTVADWAHANGLDHLENVTFFSSQDYVNSYALIEKAHFVMVYNSSIGLEASILGKAVLSAGAARYTQYPTVFFPSTAQEYTQLAEKFLATPQVAQPPEFTREARRVLYYQLFETSLPFGDYLEPHGRMGYVRLKDFPIDKLRPENSSAISAIYRGVIEGKPFLV